ncbi:MAG TPA: GntR family transcriptional regulator, partial [Saprospiraceae bacterium]|nr:GntR family transcriptional regulator [Saprospiraceae bacterium]
MDFKRQKGIYEQIAEKILFDILENNLKEGERIASVRDLAQELQVNPITVMRAYNYLNDENLIQN